LLALNEVLERLAAIDARKARIVELRYFVGLSVEETAEALELSDITVKREWLKAKAWLFREMSEPKTNDTRTMAEDRSDSR
jgi:RNA polymerase sigma factor (sigma-70 family)